MRHIPSHIVGMLALLAGAMIIVHIVSGVHFPLAPLGIALLLITGGAYVVLHQRDVVHDEASQHRRHH